MCSACRITSLTLQHFAGFEPITATLTSAACTVSLCGRVLGHAAWQSVGLSSAEAWLSAVPHRHTHTPKDVKPSPDEQRCDCFTGFTSCVWQLSRRSAVWSLLGYLWKWVTLCSLHALCDISFCSKDHSIILKYIYPIYIYLIIYK